MIEALLCRSYLQHEIPVLLMLTVREQWKPTSQWANNRVSQSIFYLFDFENMPDNEFTDTKTIDSKTNRSLKRSAIISDIQSRKNTRQHDITPVPMVSKCIDLISASIFASIAFKHEITS
jgi:hypothetical protein